MHLSKMKIGEFLDIIGKYVDQIFTAKNYLSNIKAMDEYRGGTFFKYNFLETASAALRISLIVTLSRLFNKGEDKTQKQECKHCGYVATKKMKKEDTIQRLLCRVEQNTDIFQIEQDIVSEKVKEFQNEISNLETEISILKTRRDKIYSHNDFKVVIYDKLMLADLEKLLTFADKVVRAFWFYTTKKEVNTPAADHYSDFDKLMKHFGVSK